MPARLPVTGPAELFVATHAGPVFFGTDLGDPHIQIIPNESPVYNDYGGAAPFDYMYDGEEGLLVFNLSRWDEAVYFALATRPNHGAAPLGGAASIPGVNVFGDVGSFEVQNGNSFAAIVNFPYFTAANNVAAGVPPGYTFFACELIGPDDMKVGTRTEIIQVIIRAMRVFVPRSGAMTTPPFGLGVAGTPVASAGPGGFALYTPTVPAGLVGN